MLNFRFICKLLITDGRIWLNLQQMAALSFDASFGEELFGTSKSNISMHITGILKDKELTKDSVAQNYLTTAADGKQNNVVFDSLEMILAVAIGCEDCAKIANLANFFDKSI